MSDPGIWRDLVERAALVEPEPPPGKMRLPGDHFGVPRADWRRISIRERQAIHTRLTAGESVGQVAREYGITRSHAWAIWRNREDVHATSTGGKQSEIQRRSSL